MKNDLKAVFAEMRISPKLSPRPQFVRNARIRMLNQVSPSNKRAYTPTLSLGLSLFRLALVIIVSLLLLGKGLIYTAGFSVPGGALYPLKRMNSTLFGTDNTAASGSFQISATPNPTSGSPR